MEAKDMETSDRTASVSQKFVRSRPTWVFWVRRPAFQIAFFFLLVAYALVLLPSKETSPALTSFSLGLFVVLVLGWSAIILPDENRPELLKGAIAFGLIAVFCWLFYRYSGAQWDKLTGSFFDWKRMRGSWGSLVNGLTVTLELALLSAVCSLVVGLVIAVLRSLGSPTINLFLVAFVDVFRSVPMIVLMVVLFFALPYVGISLGSITTTVVALALGYGAQASESFRAGIEAVHSGQIEAARALGLSRWQTMRLIILPQAIPIVIPPLTGNLVAMLKDTAVASVVASPELLKRARELYTSKTSPTPLVAAALIYLAVLIPLVRLSNLLENKIRKLR
jgi:His/Glu/Gln/Arg/opine family amino acid ABC transporter permease subunit